MCMKTIMYNNFGKYNWCKNVITTSEPPKLEALYLHGYTDEIYHAEIADSELGRGITRIDRAGGKTTKCVRREHKININ